MAQNRVTKPLSLFALVMMNVIAVDNLRSLPASAEYGFSLVFFYGIAALCFMIPVALISAELATGWPKSGGMYIWVKEAFGKKIGFVAIWLLWIYNVIWFPTILTFLADTFAYLINPHLSTNKLYNIAMVLGLFWFSTFINSINMKVVKWMATLSALIGTVLPMIFIGCLGLAWLYQGNPTQIHFTLYEFFPNFKDFGNLSFLTAVVFALIGLEMSSVYAGDVKNPKRDYPKAILYSAFIILLSFIFSALAIAVVIPKAKLSIVSGLIDAFEIFFNKFHLNFLLPWLVIAIVLGGMGSISTYVLGPIKALLVAGLDEALPKFLIKTNQNGMPIRLLLTQAVLVSLLTLVFVVMPTVSSSFWLLSVLTSQLALIYYLLLFMAYIKLKYSQSDIPRSYQIPGGKPGAWLTVLIGSLTCIAVLLFGFLPPSGVQVGNLYFFEGFLVFGIVVFCSAPFLLYFKPKQKRESNLL